MTTPHEHKYCNEVVEEAQNSNASFAICCLCHPHDGCVLVKASTQESKETVEVKPVPSVGWEERFMAEMVIDDYGWKTVNPSVKASIDFIRTAVREAEERGYIQAIEKGVVSKLLSNTMHRAELRGFDEAVNVVKDYIGKRFIETDTSYAVFGRLKENLDKKRTELEGKA
jgi:hypothetical protein